MSAPAVPLSAQDAIIYLMVMSAAADGNMHSVELRTIGRVVRSFPVFEDADEQNLVETAEACGALMSGPDGLHEVLNAAKAAIPVHLAETAYAAVMDVVTADENIDPTELRILQLVQETLGVSDEGADAIERAAKARHMTLIAPQ